MFRHEAIEQYFFLKGTKIEHLMHKTFNKSILMVSIN